LVDKGHLFCIISVRADAIAVSSPCKSDPTATLDSCLSRTPSEKVLPKVKTSMNLNKNDEFELHQMSEIPSKAAAASLVPSADKTFHILTLAEKDFLCP